MKTIKIKSLTLTNFKGIRNLELNDLSNETHIYGNNGVGKTTIFDAFTWLLFGKDSTDRKSFEVQRLDANNNVIPKIDSEVNALLDVDGETIQLTRIMRQKWVKRRGSLDSEYTGNETVYEWNGVPMNAGDFSKKINDIVQENVFKMISNPAAFNSLKWQDQRDVLIDMTGNINDTDIAKGNPEFEDLLSQLIGKSFDEFKKQLKASISKSKKELQTIPTRIDEVERSKPEALDFDALKTKLKEKESSLKSINDQITDELKAQQALIDKKSEIKKQIQEYDHKVSDLKHEIRTSAKDAFRKQNSAKDDKQRQFDEKNQELTTASNGLATLQSRLTAKNEELTSLESKILALRTEWENKNAEPINLEIETSCVTCNQELPSTDIEAKKEEINNKLSAQKQTDLNDINARGKALSATKESAITERDDLQKRIDNGLSIIASHNSALNEIEHAIKSVDDKDAKSEEDFYKLLLEANTEIPKLEEQVVALSKEFENIGGVNVDGFKNTRDEINKEIGELKASLSKQDQITAADNRINVLSTEESTLAQGIADLEKQMFTLEAFEKEKSTRIEQSVNHRFQYVDFKLFETQINGGEVPTCKALINGVPFSDANRASKINAGLDIINTLCSHYKANTPIFIDNRESVVELIPTESQVINLIVSEEDKALRVSDRPMSYAQFTFKEKLETV